MPVTRRSMYLSAAAFAVGMPTLGDALSDSAPQVDIDVFDSAGRSLGRQHVAVLRRSLSTWRARLAPESFAVTRQAATEPAFGGKYWNWHGDGLFRCVCCATALFDSRNKFDSGTGWPSFARPISAANIVESPDTSWLMARTAVSCKRCEAHLGHVFDDGPPPAGLRYCINSAALVFVPRAQIRS